MQLSQQAIKEFQQIYKGEFGDEISSGEAEKLGMNLLNIMKKIYKPIPNNNEGSTVRSGELAKGERRPTEATDIPITKH